MPSRWPRFFRLPALLLLFVAVHIALAPWTAQRVDEVRTQIRDWQAHRTSQKYMTALKAMPPGNVDSFVQCAVAFRDHLKKRNMRLVVVLRPCGQDLLASQGQPQSQPSVAAARLLQAETALSKAHIDVLNLLPPVHEALCREPAHAVMRADGGHLGDPILVEICAVMGRMMNERQLHKGGKDMVLAGDCYASSLGSVLHAGDVLPRVHVLWRNAGSHLIPDEIARLPDEELDGVHQVLWLATDEFLPGITFDKFPSFPSSEALSRGHDQGARTVKVTLTRLTTVPGTLGKNSPYPDALAEHEFRTAEGESLLGLIQVMRNHVVDPTVLWEKNQPLLVTLVPWEAAVKVNPDLSHEQILDDAPDFLLPRYQIARWMHAP